MIKLNNSEAIYIQIANDIIKRIANKEYQIGDKIDSVRNMAKSYLVTTNTIMSVIKYLEENHIVKRIVNVGVFINTTEQDLENYFTRLKLKYCNQYLDNMKMINCSFEEAIEIIKDAKK